MLSVPYWFGIPASFLNFAGTTYLQCPIFKRLTRLIPLFYASEGDYGKN